MEIQDNKSRTSPDAVAPMLPGFEPVAQPANANPALAPEARGRIGAQAMALGLGTKSEGEIPPDAAPVEAGPVILSVPVALGAGWTRQVASDVVALAARVLAIGETAAARRWIALLGRPRSVLFDVEAVRRMTMMIERQAAARSGTLPPVPPAIQYRTLGEIRAITAGGGAGRHGLMPAVVAEAVLDAVNARLRDLAAAGFASAEERGIHAAPIEIRNRRAEISRITGATVRVLNQIGLLRAVSRRGQTAHGPMSLDRRLRLVEDALAQLAGVVGCDLWSAADLGLVPADLRDAWQHRATAEPLPSPVARSLFEWAVPPLPRHPLALSDQDLLFEIQRNPDLDYVDRLRAERSRRTKAALDNHISGDLEGGISGDTEDGKYGEP